MTNKLVVIINSLKVPKIKKILLYEMKFLVPNYSCLQNAWRGGSHPQIPVLSVLCPQLNLLNPPLAMSEHVLKLRLDPTSTHKTHSVYHSKHVSVKLNTTVQYTLKPVFIVPLCIISLQVSFIYFVPINLVSLKLSYNCHFPCVYFSFCSSLKKGFSAYR